MPIIPLSNLLESVPLLSEEELVVLATAVLNERDNRVRIRIQQSVEVGYATLTAEEKRLIEDGSPIAAISSIRVRCQLGLAEAKMIADRYREKYRQSLALL